MPLPASQRNFSSDCLRISPHRIASSQIPLRQAAWNQPLSFSAPRCLVPNPVPHDLLLRPASSLVMLGLVLRFLQFASFRWPESNSAVFRNARCIMLAKTLRPLNIYGTCACAYILYMGRWESESRRQPRSLWGERGWRRACGAGWESCVGWRSNLPPLLLGLLGCHAVLFAHDVFVALALCYHAVDGAPVGQSAHVTVVYPHIYL